jgi:hypothetical protein
MKPDLQHLLDTTAAIPDRPRSPALPQDLQIEVGGGLRVTKVGERVIISDGSAIPLPEGSVGSPDVADPLQWMSYRGKIVKVDDVTSVVVQISYLDSVYYDSGWFHEELEIDSESLVLTGYPKLLYLRVPIKFISGLDSPDGRTDFPFATLKSEDLIFGGGPYTLYQEFSTGFIVRDRGVTPANWFTLEDNYQTSIALDSDVGTSDLSGNWYFLLARITEANGVEQIHLGALTLPQGFQFNLRKLE